MIELTMKKRIKIKSIAMLLACFMNIIAVAVSIAAQNGNQKLPVRSGTTLQRDVKYFSESGNHYLIFQKDGNLVVYDKTNRFVWGTNLVTNNFGQAAKVEFDASGVLKVSDAQGRAIWSPINQSGGTSLTILENGSLHLLDNNGNTLWSSDGSKNQPARPQPGQTSQNCNPGDNQIAIYQDWKFTGACKTVNVGEFADIKTLGFENDDASSIRVGRNVQAVLCEHNNFQGVCQTFTSNSEFLGETQVGNDKVSSLKVLAKNQATGNNPNGNAVNSNSIRLESYTGPTTKRELNITLPFTTTSQKLIVEVAENGMVIFEGDMILGNISDFARYERPSENTNSLIPSNPYLDYFINASFNKIVFNLADTKVSDFTEADPPTYDNDRLWKNSTIPYVLPDWHGRKAEILAGIKEINDKTNLCLIPRTAETDYVEFVSRDGSWSKIGRVGGRQEISIDQTWSRMPIGTVAHEIMHAAGYGHMHSREYRDNYVTINFGNIERDAQSDFQRSTDKATNIGPYDFTSILHYFDKAASLNGQKTIDVKGGGDTSKMGQRDALAPGDIATIAARYPPGTCKPPGFKPVAPPPTTAPTTPTATKPTQPVTPTSPTKTQPTTTVDKTGNVAIGKKATQGSYLYDARRFGFVEQDNISDAGKAIDGNTDGRFDIGSVSQTGKGNVVWWSVDLGEEYDVSKIVIWNRTDACCWNWQQNFNVVYADESYSNRGLHFVESGAETIPKPNGTLNGKFPFYGIGPFSPWTANKTNHDVPINSRVRYIMISVRDDSRRYPNLVVSPGLSLAEVQVFGKPICRKKGGC